MNNMDLGLFTILPTISRAYIDKRLNPAPPQLIGLVAVLFILLFRQTLKITRALAIWTGFECRFDTLICCGSLQTSLACMRMGYVAFLVITQPGINGITRNIIPVHGA